MLVSITYGRGIKVPSIVITSTVTSDGALQRRFHDQQVRLEEPTIAISFSERSKALPLLS